MRRSSTSTRSISVARARIDEAKRRGVKTLPALVVGDEVFHVNFGANLADLG